MSLSCSSVFAEIFETVTAFGDYLDQTACYYLLTEENCTDIAKQLNSQIFQLTKKTGEDAKQDQNIIFKGLSLLKLAALETPMHKSAILDTLLSPVNTAKTEDNNPSEDQIKTHRSILAILFDESVNLDSYWKNKTPQNIYVRVRAKYGKAFDEVFENKQIDNFSDLEGSKQTKMLQQIEKIAVETKNIEVLGQLAKGYVTDKNFKDLKKAEKLLEMAQKNNNFDSVEQWVSQCKNIDTLADFATVYMATGQEKIAELYIGRIIGLAVQEKDFYELIKIAEIYETGQEGIEKNSVKAQELRKNAEEILLQKN